MTGSRRLGLGLLVLLLGEAAPVWANAPPPIQRFKPGPDTIPKPDPLPQPDPIPKPDPLFFDPTPNPVPNPIPSPMPPPEPRPNDPFVKSPPPKRTGPFRSCGSGAGTGLAGIGVASALLWVGNRFVRNRLRPPSTPG